jgi:hypothetical protein
MSYTFSDLNQAFNFAKNNPDKIIDDWLEHKSKYLTQSEMDFFKDVKYTKFKIAEYEIFLFQSNLYGLLPNFINKFVGNKDFVEFDPGDNYGYSYTILTFDVNLFNIDNWLDDNNFPGLKILKNEDSNIELNYEGFSNDIDELVLERFDWYKRDKKKNNFYFHNSLCTLYIGDTDQLEFIDAINLFGLDMIENGQT